MLLKVAQSDLNLLRLHLVPKVMTARLIRFAEDEGVLEIIRKMRGFTLDALCRELELKLGFCFNSPVKRRMVATLLDFLEECGLVFRVDDSSYSAPKAEALDKVDLTLSRDEERMLGDIFTAQVDFFTGCIDEAGSFFRGDSSPYGFSRALEPFWDSFLGNYEFKTMRALLLKLMGLEDRPDFGVLDLCAGLGYGVEEILTACPSVKVTAIDFNNVYRETALARIDAMGRVEKVCVAVSDGRTLSRGRGLLGVEWATGRWGGFGHPLPFEDATYDAVYFTCADPYIPPALRAGVYGEIYRLLKPGGVLGVLTWSYPDRERRTVTDPWIRRQILVHDFAESVCDGWHGFHDPEDTKRMFSEVGFKANDVFSTIDSTLGSALWIMNRPG